MLLQLRNGFRGAGCFDDVEPLFTEGVYEQHPKKILIFND